ncbi:hypothetical protein BGZ65_010972 [Modicella reniformis]|uniref:PLC-like phosphodiesterase n=1 Tax=Modicella reniformis TaxID=1440133 RepID=A0A9P6INT5_9FUNG|nr:hypothetical protein BGZ65_010972 [Modicella reniformis]
MRTSLILSAAATLLSSSLLLHSDAQLCNGYAALCAKTYNQVVYPTTHNAYANTPPGALAANQDNNITTQLGDGIRALMLDAYVSPKNPNVVELCHTSCNLLDAGPLTTTLGQIKAFLDANPNEVITIFWENAGNLAPAQFQSAYTSAGVTNYLYTQPTGTATWPTLAEMISTNKRLVNFMDSGTDASVPWLMAEYDFIFETPYQILKGEEYPCTVDRPQGERKQMYVLNHFISQSLNGNNIPQPGAAAQTNGGDLVTHANNCRSTFNQLPSFIAVDFYERGSIFQTIAQLNGVEWDKKFPTQPKSTSVNNAACTVNSINVMAVGMVALTATLGLLAL